MKRYAFAVIIFILVLVLTPEDAYANQPPAPQTFLAEVSIAPITIALFVLSGAAAIYDRKQGIERAGFKRISTLIGLTLLCLVSGIHEGFAALLCLVLAIWAIGMAILMFRLSFDATAGIYTRWASRIFAIILVPSVIFLSSFGFVFFGEYYYNTMGRDWHHEEILQQFFEYQKTYANQHDGQYHKLLPGEYSDDLEKELRDAFYDSGVRFLAREMNRGVNRVSVIYGEDLRSYQVRLTPISFFPWPYNLFAKRKAFFMDESGKIRNELLTGPGREVSSDSPVL